MTEERLADAQYKLEIAGDDIPRYWQCITAELIAEVRRLRGLLSTYVVFGEPNAIKRYDELAEKFYGDTGVMAPGKSIPLEMLNSQLPDDARIAAYKQWLRDLLHKTHTDTLEALGEDAGK